MSKRRTSPRSTRGIDVRLFATSVFLKSLFDVRLLRRPSFGDVRLFDILLRKPTSVFLMFWESSLATSVLFDAFSKYITTWIATPIATLITTRGPSASKPPARPLVDRGPRDVVAERGAPFALSWYGPRHAILGVRRVPRTLAHESGAADRQPLRRWCALPGVRPPARASGDWVCLRHGAEGRGSKVPDLGVFSRARPGARRRRSRVLPRS